MESEVARAFWKEIRGRAREFPRGETVAKRVERAHSEHTPDGEKLLVIGPDSALYRKAVDLVASTVEATAREEHLNFAREREAIREKEFWLAVYEECGYSDQDDIVFDPGSVTMRARKAKDSEPGKPNSYLKTLDVYADLVQEALDNPLVAGHMSQDLCLPHWLRATATAVSSRSLRSALRTMLEQCVKDPTVAVGWNALVVENKMPDWMVELTSVLAARKARGARTGT